MEHYRETIIKRIIQSSETLSIEPIIYNSLQKLEKNGTHPFIVLRFIARLITSLEEIKKVEVGQKELDNVTQALNVLKDYEIKKITEQNLKSL